MENPNYVAPEETTYDIPRGWPKYPVFPDSGDVPGPPIQFEELKPDSVKAGYTFTDPNMIGEVDEYFYHGDHISSVVLVTDKKAKVVQQFAYMPFGELLVDNSTVDLDYRFSAKETDRESGLGYFGARYYDNTSAMWLGVDPLWEKYAGMTPYNYCAGNPVMLVDRDGREFDKADEEYINTKFIPKANELKENYQKELDGLTDESRRSVRMRNNLKERITEIDNSLAEVEELKKSSQKYKFDFSGQSIPKGNDETVLYGITSYSKDDDAVLMSIRNGSGDYGTVAHELKHAYQFEKGELSFHSVQGHISYLYDITDEKQAHIRGWAFDSNNSKFADSNTYRFIANKSGFSLKNLSVRESMIKTYNISRNLEYFRYNGKTYKPNK